MSSIKNTHHRHFLLLAILIVLVLFLNISLGSVYIPFDQLLQILSGGEPEKASWYHIIWQFRLPKAITAMLVGVGLSCSGLLMQTFFRNPLAGPFVLGISSGASLGVALMILTGGLFSASFSIFSHSWLLVLAASFGAGMVLLLVVVASEWVRDSMALLIIGLMFGTATSALVSVFQFFSNAEDIQAYLIWTFGSLGGMSWQELAIFTLIITVGFAGCIVLLKPLNALLLGENYAQSMGLDLKKARLAIILCTSLLAGVVTAFCGPIAFIGLAVPHIGRLIFQTSDHKTLIPATALLGILILLVCDLISQVPGSEHVLPINAVTSLIGTPVVVWVVLKRKNLSSQF